MNDTVFSFGERIQAIVEQTMRAYPITNIEGQEVSAVEYSKDMSVQRMLSDMAEMQKEFADCVKNAQYSFDDISAVFAMLCTCCAKYNLDYALGGQFDIDSFLTVVTDIEERQFLSSLGKAIFSLAYSYEDQSSNCFKEAYELFPDNEIINLYRFMGLVQLLYRKPPVGAAAFLGSEYTNESNGQDSVRRDMISSYSKLSPVLKEYAIVGKDESNARDDSLPYLEYVSYSERVMDACLSDFRGISKGADLDGNEIDNQRVHEVITAIPNERMSVLQNLDSLFRRLNVLQRLRDGASIQSGDPDRPSYMLRKSLLAIPCSVEPSATDFRNLFTETFRAEERTAERDRAIAEKAAVIQDFAHTYGNMKATGLYAIAQTLLKNEDIESKRLGRQALLEYGIKQDLTKAVYMMRLRFEENSQELRKLLRNGISEASDAASESIGDIMSSALQLSLLRVFYDTSDRKAQLARNQMKKAVEKLTPLRDSFEQAVVFRGTDAIQWMREQIVPVEVSISGGWEQLAFLRESYATVFLRDIFAECFFNALKYADLKKPISLSLCESGNELRFEIQNTVAQMDLKYNGVGLSSKSAMLDIVNGRTAKDGPRGMIWGECHGKFHTRISLDKSVLEGG